jgi:hypothetical protein
MADSLRTQIVERVKGQQQLVVVAAAVAGASLSFGAENLATHPEILALLSLLYVGLALALLRHDQEITIATEHLLSHAAFGADADAQGGWEVHKFGAMQGSGFVGFVMASSQAVGIYGVPTLAIAAFGWATCVSSPSRLAWLILGVAAFFAVVFAVGAIDTARRYRRLGRGAHE